MRAPLSWLGEHADLPAGITGRALAAALIRVGLEVESVETAADEISGPVVVGRVLAAQAEPQKNGKTINWCQVEVGEDEPRGIVCGAHNFVPGDLVVAALPGSVLPGGFAIAARKTYGHVSDGMICSARELGIGADHEGILVLPPGSAKPGDDPLTLLGMRETVLDVAVTTDRGYCLSIRGLAREAAAALGVAFHDVTADVPDLDGGAYPVRIDDPTGCDRFSARAVTDLDPTAPTPDWMAARLAQSGVRSISLAVDVTNYVMFETGQPLHAFDRARLTGGIHVRRADPGEKLTTLDDVVRTLDPADMVVADDSGAIALAGVMGGASTEIHDGTTDVVFEAAHWSPSAISRTVRRHKLPSEAARRFERDVDPEIAGIALARCVDLLVEHGGASAAPGYTVVGTPHVAREIVLAVDAAERTAGLPIPRDDVLAHLASVGCEVAGDDPLVVRPPSWRPDLLVPADLVEEVVRLVGYERLPSVLPAAAPGRGLRPRQALRRTVGRTLAGAGLTEVLTNPFTSTRWPDDFGLAADDWRRAAPRVVNPLSEDEPLLRTSLLPGLLTTLARNVSRGARDVALFETGLVFVRRDPDGRGDARPDLPGIAARPTDGQLAALDAVLPDQPERLAAVLCGAAELPGWWGPGRQATWADAVEVAQAAARAARVRLTTHTAAREPWHPGRCAQLRLDGEIVGYAGELHPRVITALGLPLRTCAVEIALDRLPADAAPNAPALSSYPPVLLDVALVVDEPVPVAAVQAALRDGAGDLLESLRLFDVYTGERLGAGVKSLAFALRFRAPDRTLTVDEASVARDAAVALAAERTGATLRA